MAQGPVGEKPLSEAVQGIRYMLLGGEESILASKQMFHQYRVLDIFFASFAQVIFCAFENAARFEIQYGPVIIWSIFSKILTRDTP